MKDRSSEEPQGSERDGVATAVIAAMLGATGRAQGIELGGMLHADHWPAAALAVHLGLAHRLLVMLQPALVLLPADLAVVGDETQRIGAEARNVLAAEDERSGTRLEGNDEAALSRHARQLTLDAVGGSGAQCV